MAVRHPVPISWIDEIIGYFLSDKPGQKKWFTRKMNQLSEEEQDEVWSALQARGHSRPDESPQETEDRPARVQISWEDLEWDQLADLVWRARKNDPTETLIGLVKKVMPQFPENRRRNIRVLKEIEPLQERLQKRDEAILAALEDFEIAKLRIVELEDSQKNIPSRDEVLGTLTDEEILHHYGQRVLHLYSPDEILRQYPHEVLLSNVQPAELAAHTIKVGVEMFVENQRELVIAVRELTATVRQQPQPRTTTHGNKPPIPMPRPITGKLPKVTVVGLLPNQQAKVEERLSGRANFNFVDKNRKADGIPENQDVILLAANFISHAMQEAAKKRVSGTATKLIVHHGGVDMLVRKLDAILPQGVLA